MRLGDFGWGELSELWGILPRDVWTEPLFANSWVLPMKPLKVSHFLQGSRKQPRQWMVLVSGFRGIRRRPIFPFVALEPAVTGFWLLCK